MFSYFLVMNDYGFRPSTLFYLDNEYGYYPKATDIYDQNAPNNGNTNYGNSEFYDVIDWLKTNTASVDLRLFYVDRPSVSWS